MIKSSEIRKKIIFDPMVVIQNPFEFPRQQESGEGTSSEASQYRASQQLQNPNQMILGHIQQQMQKNPGRLQVSHQEFNENEPELESQEYVDDEQLFSDGGNDNLASDASFEDTSPSSNPPTYHFRPRRSKPVYQEADEDVLEEDEEEGGSDDEQLANDSVVDASLNNASPSSNPPTYHFRPRRSRGVYQGADGNDSGKDEEYKYKPPPPKKARPVKNFVDVEAPNYHFRHFLNGKDQLQVLVPNDPSKCYHYYHDKRGYRCTKCQQLRGLHIVACVKKRPDGSEYVRMRNDHICQPYHVFPTEIIRTTNFEHYANEFGRELFVFLPEGCYFRYYYDKPKEYYACAKCGRLGKTTEAVVKDENGETFVEADNVHICEPLPYIEKIRAPHFVLLDNKRGNSQLVVFANNEHTLCHRFYWHKTNKCFCCHRCFAVGKHIVVKIWTSPGGEDFVQFYHEHGCAPIQYVADA